MKKWIDANEIRMINELSTKELREIDISMRQKPNFDKTEYDKESEKEWYEGRKGKYICKWWNR